MPNDAKVSVSITVKNEEGSIEGLIKSLLVQTKKADEIVICDGGSTDRTQEIIKKYKTIKLVFTKKIGIAAGRNIAIENAANEIIAMIDAGCIAKPDWLEKITKPFVLKHLGGAKAHPRGVKPSLLVAGYYEMPFSSPLQQVISVYHGIPPERFNEHNFLPSARSVAFTKTLWKKMGKFNEHLEKAGEDTEFFNKCVKSGVKIIRVKEARVVWEEILSWTLVDGVKKFFDYSKGDAQIKTSHNIKIRLIFLRYIFGLILLILGFYIPLLHLILVLFFIFYLFYPIYKWFDVVKSLEGRLWLPVIQILSDLSVMFGFLSGIIA